jgi:hypothetical protein
MNSKVILNFVHFADHALAAIAQLILSNLAGIAAPAFPTPVPTLAEIGDAYAAFAAALAAAASGNRADIADKNAKREVLVNLLIALARYINFTAEGDRALLLTTGYDVNKEKQPTTIGTPENLKIVNGDNPGELIVSVKAVKGAKSYVFEYTADATLAEGSWVSITSTSRKNVFTDLESGKTYYCRVAAVGPKGQVKFSSIGSRVVV